MIRTRLRRLHTRLWVNYNHTTDEQYGEIKDVDDLCANNENSSSFKNGMLVRIPYAAELIKMAVDTHI